MWTWLARVIGGAVVTGLIDDYKAKLAAANTQDRVAVDLAAKEIEAEIDAQAGVSDHYRRTEPPVHGHHPAAARAAGYI